MQTRKHTKDVPETARFSATLGGLKEAHAWIQSVCTKVGMPEALLNRVKLSFVEAATNVVTHGYVDHDGAEFSTSYKVESRNLRVTICDHGVPFDPVAWTPRKLPESLERGAVGGLGIRLVNEFTDLMKYVRIGDENQLTLVWTLQ